MVFKNENIEDIAFLEALLAGETGSEIISVRRLGRGETVEIVIGSADRDISLDDCAALSNRLTDDAEFRARFGAETALSVMSPGLERRLTTLRELEKFAGREVQAVVSDAAGREETLTARLLGPLDGGTGIRLAVDGAERTWPAGAVQSIKLYFKFKT